MADNYFELVGRVGWVDCKYTESGATITKITLGCNTGRKDKDGKPIYNNYFITFICGAEAQNRTAEEIADNVKKGNYIRVQGNLNIDKFIPKNSTKEVENISLIGRYYNFVKFDEFEKRYIDV